MSILILNYIECPPPGVAIRMRQAFLFNSKTNSHDATYSLNILILPQILKKISEHEFCDQLHRPFTFLDKLSGTQANYKEKHERICGHPAILPSICGFILGHFIATIHSCLKLDLFFDRWGQAEPLQRQGQIPEGVMAPCCNPLTLQPEQSGGWDLSPTSTFERHDKGSHRGYIGMTQG